MVLNCLNGVGLVKHMDNFTFLPLPYVQGNESNENGLVGDLGDSVILETCVSELTGFSKRVLCPI